MTTYRFPVRFQNAVDEIETGEVTVLAVSRKEAVDLLTLTIAGECAAPMLCDSCCDEPLLKGEATCENCAPTLVGTHPFAQGASRA